MELKDVLKLLNKKRLEIVTFSLVFGLIGIALSFVPGKFRVEGSFFIGRAADKPSPEFFTYEGYYAQQTAQSYANTAVALLESAELKKSVLDKMEIPVTDTNLRALTKDYKIAKRGPQVITLTVSDYNISKTENMYKAISENFLKAGATLTTQSDENISIIPISQEPRAIRSTRPPVNYAAAGILFGLATVLTKIALKEYLK